jgi:hypothetical protein
VTVAFVFVKECMLMREFLSLLGELFIITVLQSIIGAFIDSEKEAYMLKIINIACYVGALYIVLQFVYNNILMKIMTMFNF